MKISHSGCTVYNECSYKYFLHYMFKLRSTKKKSSFAFGDAIDSGLNTLLETRDLATAILAFEKKWLNIDFVNTSFTKSDLDESLLSGEELLADVQSKSWRSLYYKGLILLEEYNVQIMPLIKKVTKVQIDEKVPNENGDFLVIKTDFICEWHDGTIILFDNKTSSIKYALDSVKDSPQLATYYECLKEEYGIQKCGYIVLPKKINKRKLPRIKIQVIIDDVAEKTIETTFVAYESTIENIKEAKFNKNLNSCVSVYGKCDYFNYCKSGNKEGLEEQ